MTVQPFNAEEMAITPIDEIVSTTNNLQNLDDLESNFATNRWKGEWLKIQ